jgi:glutathione S-transferase
MDFYFSSVSGNSSRVAFALNEMNAPHVPHRVDMIVGENGAPAYLAINPMGKVPALVDGAVRLWESNAINWYVAEKYAGVGLLPPTPDGRASVLRWLLFQASHVSPACVPIFRATNARVQAFWRSKGDAYGAEHGRKELARFLPVLEQALSGRQWLEGDFTLADIAYAPHLWLIAEGGFDFSATPGVRGWLDRLVARPAWQAAARMVYDV